MMRFITLARGNMKNKFGILFWLLIWQLAAVIVKNRIFLVGPYEVLKALIVLLPRQEFWRTAGTSLFRIACGFTGALLLGILLAAAASANMFVKELLRPLLSLMKTVPVASVVILLLIWAGSENLSMVISFVIVFPAIYFGTLTGIEQTDQKILEMAKVFRISRIRKIWYIYRPAVIPYLQNACKSAVGMGWKSGVAAEVIGVPEHTIGERLYLAKISLETADLFAWTAVVLALSLLCEKLIFFILDRLQGEKGNGEIEGDCAE